MYQNNVSICHKRTAWWDSLNFLFPWVIDWDICITVTGTAASMMMAWLGNAFRIPGLLWEEFYRCPMDSPHKGPTMRNYACVGFDLNNCWTNSRLPVMWNAIRRIWSNCNGATAGSVPSGHLSQSNLVSEKLQNDNLYIDITRNIS